LPSAFAILSAGRFLPTQHDPVSFALNCDHLAPQGFVEETEPTLSGL
jgi:hypothetical protein